MKKFIAEIEIMPHREILDPQGKAVKLGLGNLGIKSVQDVRVGKHVVISLDAESEAAARETVELACKKLLVNVITEEFQYEVKLSEA